MLPLLPVAHLDREFDYLIPAELDDQAQPGVRVRVRFSGRLVDGYLLERIESSEHPGKLGWLDRVVSAEPVLTAEVRDLVDAVAQRYAGTRTDVLRLAVPPRHAKVESEEWTPRPVPEPPKADREAWSAYTHGINFLEALEAGRGPRAAWQALPGEDWTTRLAELAGVVAATGRGVILVVPDQRDLDRLLAACESVVGADHVVGLAAGLGPAARYRRWLAALRGTARIVVGTRASVFAPTPDIGLVVVWDDGDSSLSEPRSPYPHAREVALLRAHSTGCAVVIAGHARTAEAQALVDSGWAHDLVAARDVVRARAPMITALADSDHALARDPGARAARLPGIAFAAARQALAAGHGVLVQVPRRGYVPSLACAKCRAPARCRRCNGPLALPAAAGPDGAGSPTCKWCGVADTNHRCHACGARALRAVVVGAGRTAEELGRAFAGTAVHTSGGSDVKAEISPGPKLVVSTVGAEPVMPGGYGAALLLDGWALLGRADLRAAEETLRRWMTASALVRPQGDGGQVVVVADSGIPTVQALVRWDPVWHARGQLEERAEVGFPPAVHLAAIDGTVASIGEILELAALPESAEVLGPVPLPPGERLPFSSDEPEPEDVERMLVRVPRADGRALAKALAEARAVRSARRSVGPVRVQVDPLRIG
ncbi:primosomal protein N' [Rhodococcus hoagii]|uniref:Probable replication restart protein PriA n=1 Tax=Rhodococcus hoagii TaxID=43767 RepID=A0AAE3BCN5_RHOHA|nr:primosomal protein N' [Prescottella equi]MBM4717013.1 primosomal protein N' [Prescottella equi]NKS13326.1 primosomal protein N' [Prescottella equi]NKS43178.1 primosomal protein N' [Prescottella equi]ORL98231.1 primosome assembly protein PriA [Prescottella equi]